MSGQYCVLTSCLSSGLSLPLTAPGALSNREPEVQGLLQGLQIHVAAMNISTTVPPVYQETWIKA